MTPPSVRRNCGAEHGAPELSAQSLGHYLGHIQDLKAVPSLHALAHEIEDAFPLDEATPRLVGVTAAKIERLVGAN